MSDDLEIMENLPPLHLCKAAFGIMADVKFFLDKLEINGPTAHLSFLNYLTLEFKLFRKEIGIGSTLQLSKKTAGHIRSVMGNKLWPYSSSSFSKAAAYLTGINFKAKIKDLIDSIAQDATLHDICITSFMESWLKEANDFDSIVKDEIRFILNSLPKLLNEKSINANQQVKVSSADLFDSLFDTNEDTSTTEMESDVDILLSAEFKRFELQRKPTHDVQSFWKDFLLLRRAAIILLSVPASSAAVERLFSEAGLILTKLRRRLDSGKLKALVYIKYASKYTDLYNLAWLSNSPESSRLLCQVQVWISWNAK